MSDTAIKPRDFGTSGNYPAGSDAWSGQPRVVALADTQAQDGFTPNTPAAAEEVNGLFQESFYGRNYSVITAMQRWQKTRLPDNISSNVIVYGNLAVCKLPAANGELRESVIACGHNPSASNHFTYARSYGGSGFFENTAADTSDVRPRCVAGGAEGEIINGISGGWNVYSGFGATLNTYTTSFDPVAVHYMRGAGVYLTANKDDGKIGRATVLTGVTPFTDKSTGASSFAIASSSDTPGGEFADNGANAVVFLASSVVGGVTRLRAFSSTDAGLTWTIANTFNNGLTGNLIYSQALGVFAILLSDGSMWASAVGNSFALVCTRTIPGLSSEVRTMACAGHCIAKLVNVQQFSANVGRSVAYTFDGGKTWRLFHLQDNNDGIQQIVAANNRFYIADSTNHVYMSDPVAYEAPDVII